jgi:hypothetical protein
LYNFRSTYRGIYLESNNSNVVLLILIRLTKTHERFNQTVAKIELKIYFRLEIVWSILATIQDLTEKGHPKILKWNLWILFVSVCLFASKAVDVVLTRSSPPITIAKELFFFSFSTFSTYFKGHPLKDPSYNFPSTILQIKSPNAQKTLIKM